MQILRSSSLPQKFVVKVQVQIKTVQLMDENAAAAVKMQKTSEHFSEEKKVQIYEKKFF